MILIASHARFTWAGGLKHSWLRPGSCQAHGLRRDALPGSVRHLARLPRHRVPCSQPPPRTAPNAGYPPGSGFGPDHNTAIRPRMAAISTVWLAMISSAICRTIGSRPMNQHRPRHIRHAFVMRNQHRQKIGVGLTGVAGAVHVLHHAGHAGVHVGLKAACLSLTVSRFVTALVPERQSRDCRYRRRTRRSAGC